MAHPVLYPRFVEPRLVEALEDTPAVLIHGPRQSGKTTLARHVGEADGYAYFNFDDEVLLGGAQASPRPFWIIFLAALFRAGASRDWARN